MTRNKRLLFIFSAFLILGCHYRNEKPDEALLFQENEADPSEAEMPEPVFIPSLPVSNVLTNISNIGIFNYAGAINCILVDETDSMHLLAGAANGGIWKSNDRALSWHLVNDFANSLQTTSLAQNHFRQGEFYYSTGNDIYANGNLLNDIYMSTDGGNTFSNVVTATAGIGKINKIVCSTIDSNTVYMASYSGSPASGAGGTLYRTTDHFTTIEQVYHIPFYDLTDLMIMPNGEVAFAEYGKIWQSPTGNPGSFVQSNSGLPGTGVGRIKLAHCKMQPAIRYAALAWGNYNGLFKSVNGGQTWVIVDTLGNSPAPPKISVKPDDPDFIIMGQVNLMASTNGGVTWQATVGGYDIRSINFDPTRSGKVFITSDFGISSIEVDPLTTTSFTQEYFHDSLLIVQEIHAGDFFASGSKSITGNQDLGTRLIRTNLTDVFCQGGDGIGCWGSKQDSNLAYMSSQNGILYKAANLSMSSNGVPMMNQLDTNHDYSIDEGAPFLTAFLMNHADDQQLYMPTNKRLWRSLDGGTNWMPVSNFYGNAHYRMMITGTQTNDPNVFWTNLDSIFVLPHAATAAPLSEFGFPVPTLAKKIIRDPFNDSCLYFISEIVIQGQQQEILHSSNVFNGNVTWTNWGINFPDEVSPTCLVFYPGNDQVALAGSLQGGIYVTTDFGASWSKESGFPNVQIKEIKIRPSDKKVFIYTYGRGTWTADFSSSVGTQEIFSRNFDVFPNPCTDVLHFMFDKTIPDAGIRILDLQGKLLHQGSLGNAGHFIFDTSVFSPGIYLFQLTSKGKPTMLKKVVKK